MAAPHLIDGYLIHMRVDMSASPRTIAARRRTLTVLDRELPNGLYANADELRDWLHRERRKGQGELSAGSRETYFGAMVGFFGWACTAGHLDYDPTTEMTWPKVEQRLPRPVSDAQLMDVLARAREPYLTWVKLAAWAGMRCLDIANQPREEITPDAIVIRKSKGLKARVIPTHEFIWEAVCDLPPGPLTQRRAEYISQSTANYFSRTMGLPGVSLHRFRHWFGTMVQRLYKDLRVTQDLLGHKDPRTTAGYALVAAEQFRGAIDLLPTFAVARAAVPAGRLQLPSAR